jgi:hypothetical protein
MLDNCDSDIGAGDLEGGITVVAVDRVTASGFTVTGGGNSDTRGDTGMSNEGDELVIGDGVDGRPAANWTHFQPIVTMNGASFSKQVVV